MCLAVPGRVTHWLEQASPFRSAQVEFDGVRRAVNMECVPEAQPGDYVLVHAGIAIHCIDSEEAERLLAMLQELQEAEGDLDLPGPISAPEDSARGDG